MKKALPLALVLSLLLGCGPAPRTASPRTQPDPNDKTDPTDPPVPPVTSASPAGRTQVGPLAVVLSSDRAATVRYTLDGSDPAESATRQQGPSPLTVLLSPPARVSLRFSAVDADGVEEETRTEAYVLLEALGPGSISGRIVLHEVVEAGQVFVGLYDDDPAKPGVSDRPVGFQTLAAGGGARGTYAFENLPDGQYWVAAAYWKGASAAGDPQAYTVAGDSPVRLGGGATRVDFVDLYFGLCDPRAKGAHGEVFVGQAYRHFPVAVLATDRPLKSDGSTGPLAFGLALGAGERRAFALCDVSAPQFHLFAGAYPPGSDSPVALSAFHRNPVSGQGLTHATLHLGDMPEEGLGSVSGRVRFSRPVAYGAVRMLLTAEPPSASSPMLGVQEIALTSGAEYGYRFTGLGDGLVYVTAQLRLAGQDAYFPAAAPARIRLPAAPDQLVDIEIPLGEVRGDVEVRNAPAALGKVAVLAFVPGAQEPVRTTVEALRPPDEHGVRAASYMLIGLEDGAYDMVAVVDANGDGAFEDDVHAGHLRPGEPARVSVEDGDGARSDFVFDFGP